VIMAARPQDAEDAKAAMPDIEVWSVPLDDSWARDMGPTFLKGHSTKAAVLWRFNAWGNKYDPFDQDALFAQRVVEKGEILLSMAPQFVCEGGAIHSDGQGILLTTEQCLLNPNRNPGWDKAELTEALCQATGTKRVIWLGGTFSDTETDGHIDNIACFAAPGQVIVGVPDSKSHPDHAPVMDAIRQLKSEGMEVIELVQPRTIRHDRQGRLLQNSYVNFYLCNGGLIMPSFDDAHDGRARDTLAACFPGRDISVIPALDIVEGGGGIHCITQQEPA